MRVFGLGFTTPYLAPFRGEASVLGALMPAELGAVPWPEQGQSVSALVEETELPLDDESADRILLVHMLEWSEKSRALLRELWRVLAPNGRLLLVVPNRRGLWARVDTTPFGYGSPFSRSQLTKLLKEALFSPEEWEYALYMPPFNWAVLLRWPLFWETARARAVAGLLRRDPRRGDQAGLCRGSRSRRRAQGQAPHRAHACRGYATDRRLILRDGPAALLRMRMQPPHGEERRTRAASRTMRPESTTATGGTRPARRTDSGRTAASRRRAYAHRR